MFKNRSKVLLGGLIFELVLLVNLASLFVGNLKIMSFSILVLLIAIILGFFGFYKRDLKFLRFNILLSVLFVVFSGVFAFLIIPLIIIVFIGYLRQAKKSDLIVSIEK